MTHQQATTYALSTALFAGLGSLLPLYFVAFWIVFTFTDVNVLSPKPHNLAILKFVLGAALMIASAVFFLSRKFLSKTIYSKD